LLINKNKILVVCMSVCLLLQMEELYTVTVLLQVAALVMGTNFNNVTKMTEQPQPPSECFHQTPAACSDSGCTYLSAKNDTAVCCKLNNFALKERIAGTVSFSLDFMTSSSQATEFRKPTDENNTPTNFTHFFGNQNSSVGIVTRHGLESPGIESWWGARFCAPLHTHRSG
jgi:hypothetical protein